MVTLEARKDIEEENWAAVAWLSTRPSTVLYARRAVRYMYSMDKRKS